MSKKLLFTTLSLCFFCTGFSQRDTIKNKLYSTMTYDFPIFYLGKASGDKYFNSFDYEFQWAPYHFRTPGAGIGFMHRKKNFFFKTELSFYYGFKKLELSRFKGSSSIDKNLTAEEENNYFPYLYPMGTEYYNFNESFSGKVFFYNLDWDFNIGSRLFNNFSIYTGFKKNYLLNYTVKGEVYRSGSKWSYNGPYMQSTYMGPASAHIYNNDAKKIMQQNVSGVMLFSIGANNTYKIKNKMIFADLSINSPTGFYRENARYVYLSLKIAYFL